MPIHGQMLNNTYVVQNACNAGTCHEIQVVFENDNIQIESRMIAAAEIPMRDSRLPLQAMEDNVQDWLDSIVGHLQKPLLPKGHLQVALEGTKLAEFINKAQMAYTGAEISCTSLANQVSGLPKDVRVRDVLLTYPFPNTLVILEITGCVLQKALERTAEYFEIIDGEIQIAKSFLKPKVEHYNFDFYYGITYDIAYDAPVGNRISNIRVRGKSLESGKYYQICMNNYRASGAGGYEMYVGCKIIKHFTKDIFETLLEYIGNEKTGNESGGGAVQYPSV